MITITTVLRGEILSGTDRTRSKATGQFLTAPCHQRRLAFIHHQIRRAGLYGKGDREVIRGIEYRAIFGPDWLIEADVQFVLGSRHKNQLPDIDNIWSAFQNAMAFPAAKLKVAPPVRAVPSTRWCRTIASSHATPRRMSRTRWRRARRIS